jgi:methionyl-tRNA synthetase
LPEKQKILVAVAWPYASGPRHIGHVAGFGVPSDIFARYHRLRGNDVLMVSGTDEHGTPVMVAADKEGVSPRELADRYNKLIREDLRNLGLSYDTFTRTTTRNHYSVTQDMFRTLYERGYLIERTTLGAFSASTGNALPDRYIEGTCPICGYGEARGDQCDNCGNQLDPVDLKNPHSVLDGSTPEFRETKHLFLDLPRFKDQLTAWIESQTQWRANVRRFSLNFARDVKPRAMTRDIDWGVPVPVDGYPEETKRIYVWFDAVIGYLSAAVEWAHNRGTPEAWRNWWQNGDARHYYFMGKDNIVFHSVIWPSMLLGYGEGGEVGAGRKLELPYEIVSSEFLTMEGKKFSSSRAAPILVGDFLSRYDPDPLRYYLTAAGPESQDTDFTWEEFVRRNNDELLANWGNLVNRVLVNAHRNFGEVPQPGPLTDEDEAVLRDVEAGFASVGEHIEHSRFRAGLAEAMRVSGRANQYVSDQAPWAVIKEDRERAATILYVGLRAVDSLKTIFTPFLPFTSQRVHELLGREGWIAGPLRFETATEDDGSTHEVLTGDYETWTGSWAPDDLPPGQRLREPEPLFKKLDPSIVDDELRRMSGASPEADAA